MRGKSLAGQEPATAKRFFYEMLCPSSADPPKGRPSNKHEHSILYCRPTLSVAPRPTKGQRRRDLSLFDAIVAIQRRYRQNLSIALTSNTYFELITLCVCAIFEHKTSCLPPTAHAPPRPPHHHPSQPPTPSKQAIPTPAFPPPPLRDVDRSLVGLLVRYVLLVLPNDMPSDVASLLISMPFTRHGSSARAN